MKFLIPRERHAAEHRVAATPETIQHLLEQGHSVIVESGAGRAASFPDSEMKTAGAEIVEKITWSDVEALLKVGPLSTDDVDKLPEGCLVIGLLDPYMHPETVARLIERRVTSFALELVPRITRAQTMDALSSQASIGGYKAVVLAASRLGRYFPLLMTAAGTVPPAKVVIIGAGVAGLQAIATAKRLGAVVEVSDIRPAVKEQVESLGGRYIEAPEAEGAEDEGGYAKEMGEDFLARQRELLAKHIAAADVVITTAQVPGRAAPRIVSREMIEGMKPGSVVIDLAASSGGNCELTQSGEEVVHNDVLILGPANLPATMAHDASTLYARNILALIEHITPEGNLTIDPADDVQVGALLTHDGEVINQAVREALSKKEE
ncbi:MAG: Re/Si-specific NAD(P)(+) transhydrogenase subunit alpha [bacterium]|nr:Re/Si-specific NAD(P)(+) transhydrogenase subunit alpha [bacterium]